jgi:putative transcriptional regulator
MKKDAILDTADKTARRQRYSFIGKTIRFFRTQKGWNQSELATAAQLEQPQLSDYENGKTLPTSDVLYEICDALEIDPVDFTAKSLELKKERETELKKQMEEEWKRQKEKVATLTKIEEEADVLA